MTARVGRLAGAILLDASGEWFLVGNTKEPCDWKHAGFGAPAEIDAVRQPWIHLNGNANAFEPCLTFHCEGVDALGTARIISSRFLIRRNGSVSERLWRIVTGQSEDASVCAECVDATWLITLPDRVWDIVRDAALKCL